MNSQEYDFNENKIIIKNRELSYEVNEEMKVLRTNIQFSGSDTKVIVMTSCIGLTARTSPSVICIAQRKPRKKSTGGSIRMESMGFISWIPAIIIT